MKKFGSGLAGAMAGLVAAPIGGVVWLFALVVRRRGGEDLDTTSAEWFEVALTFGFFATIIAGVPGAFLGLMIGRAFGSRPLGIHHGAVAAAVGAAAGVWILGGADGDRGTSWLLTAGVAGAVAGAAGFAAFLLLRRPASVTHPS